ncbi:hypothetical protein FOZ62_017005, partial [Perkinsus olseni]
MLFELLSLSWEASVGGGGAALLQALLRSIIAVVVAFAPRDVASAVAYSSLSASPVSPSAGTLFNVTLAGSGFNASNSMAIVNSSGTCTDAGLMIFPSSPCTATSSSLSCENFQLYITGTYTVCVCPWSVCSIVLAGAGFQAADRIKLVYPSASHTSPCSTSEQYVNVTVDLSTLAPSSSGSSLLRWDSVVVLKPAVLDVCYCSPATAMQCLVHGGTLTVLGPSSNQTHAPLSAGLAGAITIGGTGLNSLSRVKVLPASQVCGSSASDSAGLLSIPTSPSLDANGSVVYNNTLFEAPGSYRLCWCGKMTMPECRICCVSPWDYSVDAGLVDVTGPEGNIIVTPPTGLGSPFVISIRGTGLAQGDRIRVIKFADPCSTSSAVQNDAGVVAPPAGGPNSGNSTYLVWSSVVIGVPGNYRICYCASLGDNCVIFPVNIGIINSNTGPLVILPAASTKVTSGVPFSVQIQNRGVSMEAMAMRMRIVATNVLCGRFGASTNHVAVPEKVCRSNVCSDISVRGPPTSVLGPDLDTLEWDQVTVTESGAYKICTCPSGPCTEDAHFLVESGSLSVIGVADTGQEFVCSAYTAGCTVRVAMDDEAVLSDGSGGLVVLPSWGTCSNDDPVLNTVFSEGTRLTGTRYSSTVVQFEAGIPRQVGVFNLCWCPGVSSCTELSDYTVPAGSLRSKGLTTHSTVCYLRVNCKVVVSGDVTISDRLVATDAINGVCGGRGTRTYGTHDNTFNSSAGHNGLFADGQSYFNPSSLDSETKTITLSLGIPLVFGSYKLCHCDGTAHCSAADEFVSNAGRVVIRGPSFGASLWSCDQGVQCLLQATADGFAADDGILLVNENEECGLSRATALTSSPSYLGSVHSLNDDQTQATFIVDQIEWPGRYKVCYCAYVSSASGKACDGSDGMEHFEAPIGTVVVAGSVSEISTRQAPFSTVQVASVGVYAVTSGGSVVCSALSGPTVNGTAPTHAQVREACQGDDGTEGPACLGVHQAQESLIAGLNLVHIDLSGADNLTRAHVWCFHTQQCPDTEEECLALPLNGGGVVVPLQSEIRADKQAFDAVIHVPFSIHVPFASIHQSNYGTRDWARLKIAFEEDCAVALPASSVVGLSCVNAVSCSTPPSSVSLLGMTWSNITVTRAVPAGMDDELQVCYCDRLNSATGACSPWVNLGTVTIGGPVIDPTAQPIITNPGSPFTVVTITGHLLRPDNRAMVVDGGIMQANAAQQSSCGMPPSNGSFAASIPYLEVAAVTNVSGGMLSQEFKVPQLTANGLYYVCWCGSPPCDAAFLFSVEIASIVVEERVDCVVGEWWALGDCSKPCGTGSQAFRRNILVTSRGGGTACPIESLLTKTVQCNTDLCPVAVVESATTVPPDIAAGVPFKVVVDGDKLSPAEDRVMLFSASSAQCGADNATHYGGAACNYDGHHDQRLVCGDGVSSIRITNEATVRVCICDYDYIASKIATSGAVASEVVEPCSKASHYELQPVAGGVIRVGPSSDFGLYVGPDGPASEASSTWPVILVAALVCMLAAAGALALYRRSKRKEKQNLATTDDSTTTMLGDDDLPSFDFIKQWDDYYVSIGYKRGTAFEMFGITPEGLTAPKPLAILDTVPTPPRSRTASFGALYAPSMYEARPPLPQLMAPPSMPMRPMTPPMEYALPPPTPMLALPAYPYDGQPVYWDDPYGRPDSPPEVALPRPLTPRTAAASFLNQELSPLPAWQGEADGESNLKEGDEDDQDRATASVEAPGDGVVESSGNNRAGGDEDAQLDSPSPP